MTSPRLEYQLRIRNAAGTADALTVTSVRGGTAPYITAAPTPDGSEFDPLTGAYRSGACTVHVADAITSGTSRLVTAQLEDATFRQQLTGRSAFVEERVNGGAWTVVQAGIVTALRLGSPAVWEIDVGDVTRATRNLLAFAPKPDPTDATQVEPLATYLARWPNRGCIAGGPVIGGFLNRADLGGWTFTVKDRQISETTSYTPSGGSPVTTTLRVAYLEFVSGYAASVLKDPSLSFARRSRFADVREQGNAALGTITNDGATTFPRDVERPPLGGWRDVVVQIGSQYFAGINAYAGFGAAHLPDNVLLSDTRDTTGLFVMDSAARLTIGATVTVRIFDALPTDRSPIYYSGHPLDLWTKLCDEAGLAYDASAVATCKAALGSALTINLRITATQSWSSFVEGVLYGPCGFSTRIDATGRLVPFATRITGTAIPAVTLGAADVPQDATVLFELTEPDAITRLTVNETNLITNASISSALDGVDVQSVTVLRTSGDAAGPVQREQSYTIPGFLATGGAQYEPGLVDALARNVFDRYGRGRLTGEIVALRGGAGDAITLGQEVLVAVPSMPNHNKRYGDDNTVGGRVVQVVRVTQMPDGKHLRFLDSGPNAQAASPLPIVALATGATTGSAGLSITNAATLNAVPIGVRVQWAQTTGAAPAAGDYSDVAWFDYGKVPTVVSPLPAVTPGLVVWVQARSEQAGRRPSAYSTPVSITTAAPSAPTGLTLTPDAADGSRVTFAFTIGTGSAALATDVFVRLQTDPATLDVRRLALLPGSTQGALDGLAQATAYTVSVQHRDTATGALSAKSTANVTTSAAVAALPAPTKPNGIVGSTDLNGVQRIDGTYGLDVAAAILPGTIEFWEGTETAVGSGLYGAAVFRRTVPAVNAGATSWRSVAPSDGLRRQMIARHVRSGATASAFTYPVAVLPWGSPLGTFVEAELYNLREVQTATQATFTFTPSSTVAEVWWAARTVTAPQQTADWDNVSAAVAPLAAGVNTVTVTLPTDGQLLLLQLEPRRADLSAGIVRRVVLTAAAQPPIVELDDHETTTTGTQFWKVTERGIPVSAVRVQTQVGTNPISAFVAPTRSAGAASVVRPTANGGVLQAGEYEHDVTLDPTRFSWIMPQLTLANGAAPIILGPFGFDRDKRANILSVVKSGTTLTITGDSDTLSIRVFDTLGTWEYKLDGMYGVVDVSATGTNAVAGLGASATSSYTVEVYNAPKADAVSANKGDTQTVSISGGSVSAPAATWSTVTASAPSIGSADIPITLQATAAPVGWTAKVFVNDPSTSAATDVSASLSPAVTMPTTALTTFHYTAVNQRATTSTATSLTTVIVTAYLYDNTATLRDTKSARVSYSIVV